MLNENIRTLRKARGLSQEELAVKLNVVRQTVSKWEKGRSVPDADLLISLSEALDTPVSTLLGEASAEPEADDLQAISEKLEVITLQLAQSREARRRTLHVLLIALCVIIVIITAMVIWSNSIYLSWDYRGPETNVIGVALHAFEWVFGRVAPPALVGAVAGAVLTRKKG